MKKKLTPHDIMQAIRKGLTTTEGIRVGAFNENVNYYRRFTNKGMFKIRISTNCEGSVIGTYDITYYPDRKLPEEYDVHSSWIVMNDTPERVIKDILDHSDPIGVVEEEYEIPICPDCGSYYPELMIPYRDKDGNYIRHQYRCSCGCEFDMPVKKLEPQYDYYIEDELGGVHTDGVGFAPDGTFCGECTYQSCTQCKAWNKEVK